MEMHSVPFIFQVLISGEPGYEWANFTELLDNGGDCILAANHWKSA
jgi:hypothetical protein